MATLDSLQFEMERRVVLFKPTTTMPDDTSLGYNGDPNSASGSGSAGEILLYNAPVSTRYAQMDGTNTDVVQEWVKQSTPNTWVQLGSGGDASLGNVYDRLDALDASVSIIDASIIDLQDGKVSINGDIMTGSLYTPLLIAYDVSVERDVFIQGSVDIGGSLRVDGSTTFVHTIDLEVSTNWINLNTGLVGTPPNWLQSGVLVERGSLDPYAFLFDETDQTFRIGTIPIPDSSGVYPDASTQAVATREDVPINEAVAVWNDVLRRFDTSIGLKFNQDGLYLDGSLKISPLSGPALLAINSAGFVDVSTNLGFLRESSIGDTLYFDSSGYLQVDPSSSASGIYNTTLDSSLEMPTAVGGYPAGTTVADLKGDTLIQLWDNLLFPTVNPTYVTPNNSFSDNVSSLQKVGAIISPQFTAAFNKGEIQIAGNFQDYRSGDPSSYIYTDPSSNTLLVQSNTSSLSDIQTISGYEVIIGTQTFTNQVIYDEGPQPLDNKGNPYGAPLPSGTTSSKSTSFEGVYPLFGTTSAINNPDSEQTLVSMISGNNIVFNMVAESGGNKQSFDIPDEWTGAPTNRTLQGVETYNTVSGSWEYQGGSASNSLTYWTTSSTSHNVEGNTINYTRYTYNSVDRSNIQIRLKF
jgi:hypothetical protein